MNRVLLVDDHPLMLSGIEAALRDTDYRVVGALGDGSQVCEALAKLKPDLIILDVKMRDRGGMEVLRTLRGRKDLRPVIFLTAHITDGQLLEALDLGVNGIVLKEHAGDSLIKCLTEVRRGGRWMERSLLERALQIARAQRPGGHDPITRLSPRERSILALVAQGLRNKEIGEDLGMSEGSVKVYLHRMYEKLGVQSRVELAMLSRSAAA